MKLWQQNVEEGLTTAVPAAAAPRPGALQAASAHLLPALWTLELQGLALQFLRVSQSPQASPFN